jgi:molybdate-binding protein/DNA-binding transcriptional regulator YhcF (GntR family)
MTIMDSALDSLSIVLVASAGPIYQQIVEQIKAARVRGDLQPGDRLPTVRALAARLSLNRNTVAAAYRVLHTDGVVVGRPGHGTLVAEPGAAEAAGAARLQQQMESAVRDALMSGIAPTQIETVAHQAIQRWQPVVQPRQSPTHAETVIHCLGSHDFCLDVLAQRLHVAYPHVRLTWAPIGSTQGLLAVGRGMTQLAGVHLLDPMTGDYNRPFAQRLLPDIAIRFVTLVHREQGLIVRRGNPRELRAVVDLTQPGVRFAHRQAGSGTRLLLEHLLARHGLTIANLSPPTRELTTHLEVAAAVASGSADVGLGVRAAAQALDLDFVPLTTERYDLAFRSADIEAHWLGALLEVLASPAFRADIAPLDGYDASRTGWLN